MPTTTIRIEEELKARIGAAAQRAGETAHAFILDAIAEMVQRDELDEELHRLADSRWEGRMHSGKSVPRTDAKAYLQARARGEKPHRPAPRKPLR